MINYFRFFDDFKLRGVASLKARLCVSCIKIRRESNGEFEGLLTALLTGVEGEWRIFPNERTV